MILSKYAPFMENTVTSKLSGKPNAKVWDHLFVFTGMALSLQEV